MEENRELRDIKCLVLEIRQIFKIWLVVYYLCLHKLFMLCIMYYTYTDEKYRLLYDFESIFLLNKIRNIIVTS